MGDEFISDRVEIFGRDMIVAIERSDNNIFDWQTLFFNIFGDFVPGIGKIWAFTHNLAR